MYSDVFLDGGCPCQTTFVNGTHALTLALAGILRPGDELIYCTGNPYDTLEEVIGIRGKDQGSLRDFGVEYKQVELKSDGSIDRDSLKKAISPKTKMTAVQRSTGYGWRKAVTISEIEEWASFVKSVNPNIVCMVDNCYGEFLDTREPSDAGAPTYRGLSDQKPAAVWHWTGGYIYRRTFRFNRKIFLAI